MDSSFSLRAGQATMGLESVSCVLIVRVDFKSFFRLRLGSLMLLHISGRVESVFFSV